MIGIVTDSTCDLPREWVDRTGALVVPLSIRFGDEEFTDGIDLDTASFWERLAAGGSLPETSAPSAGAFHEAFEALASQGATGIVVVCLSAHLSATYQSAVIAAERFSAVPVRVIDSRTVSMALGLQVIAAADKARAGGSLEDVVNAALAASASANLFAALDTLEFLRRGGRIGGAQALLANLLDVKPLITFVDGVVAPAGRVRTRSKARSAIVGKVVEVADRLQAVAVIHGAADGVDELVAEIKNAAAGLDPIVAELGPVVGTHAGPGTVGVAYVLS